MKSTVVLDRLAFLLVDVLVDHLIGDRPGGDRKVAACPEVPTPELAPEVRKLLQKVTSPDRDRARQHPLTVLGDPDEVNLEIIARVAAEAVSSHDATSPTFPFV